MPYAESEREAMNWDQGAILAVAGCTLAVFGWDGWRYHVVAIRRAPAGRLPRICRVG